MHKTFESLYAVPVAESSFPLSWGENLRKEGFWSSVSGYRLSTQIWKEASKYARPKAKRDRYRNIDLTPQRKAESNRNRNRRRNHAPASERERRRSFLLTNRTKYELITAQWLRRDGVCFTEQECILGFYADFRLSGQRLIELDGRHHLTDPAQREQDRRKQKALNKQGFSILRVWNRDLIERNWPGITRALETLPPGLTKRFRPATKKAPRSGAE